VDEEALRRARIVVDRFLIIRAVDAAAQRVRSRHGNSGPDLVGHRQQAAEHGSSAAPFDEVQDGPSLGVGEHGVE